MITDQPPTRWTSWRKCRLVGGILIIWAFCDDLHIGLLWRPVLVICGVVVIVGGEIIRTIERQKENESEPEPPGNEGSDGSS
jgi:hypothetical protein